LLRARPKRQSCCRTCAHQLYEFPLPHGSPPGRGPYSTSEGYVVQHSKWLARNVAMVIFAPFGSLA
jgi:hypothetical protein